MGQRPIINGGVVVNVIEIDDDCAIMTKAECRKQEADEVADYEMRSKAWREQIAAMRADLAAAQEKAGLARATLEAVKVQAAAEKESRRKSGFLDQILTLDNEVKAHAQAVSDLAARPMPAKPKLARCKRWFHADEVMVGPPGGNIGDRWDGSKYIVPEVESVGPDPK